MKDNLTEIAIILDKSGSMGSIRNDTIGGFNSFIDDQKKLPGEANVTLVLFDTSYDMRFKSRPLGDIEPLTEATYIPQGGTALNDAVGRTINTIGQDLANLPEDKRPGKVLFVIITDGEENASKEFTLSKVNEMIKHQKETYSWEFIFIGTNDLNVDNMAMSRGITLDKTLSFDKSAAGTRDMYASIGAATAQFRAGAAVDMSLYQKAPRTTSSS